jgi:acetoin utilization deacetylase AcuC-like enzyme
MAAHDPPGGHPERPARLAAALAGARAAGVVLHERTAAPATAEALERVHPAAYLEALAAAAEIGGWIDHDTYIDEGTARAYPLAVGAAVEAVEGVLAGDLDGAFCVVRPPGHHAGATTAMGFCYANNVAVAARAAQAVGARRVAIVDWDVHHGNGTQDVFWRDPDVLYVSLHQSPFYPMTGAESQVGAAAGKGTTLNLGLAHGTGSERYLERFEGEALPAVEAFEPALVLVSCGFDGHADDPLAGLELDDETFARLTRGIVEVAARCSAPRPVVVLEGGYDLGVLERATALVVAELAG